MTEGSTAEDNAARGYTITRLFDAPRALVWKAFTEPEQFAQWFGPAGSRLEAVSMDVRPGGAWRATMILSDGTEIPWVGSYLEVVEPERLVFTLSDQGILANEFDRFTVTLTNRGDKTELVLRQSGGHLTDEQYAQAKEGTSSFLDRMAELLAKSR